MSASGFRAGSLVQGKVRWASFHAHNSLNSTKFQSSPSPRIWNSTNILRSLCACCAWRLAHSILPWAWEPAMKPGADNICTKRSKWNSKLKRLQLLTLAHASGLGNPSEIWSDWKVFSWPASRPCISCGWKEFEHGTKPIELHPEPGNVLWNQVLTQLAPRDLKILIGFHMRGDGELLVLMDFT